MKICVITPAEAHSRAGNRITALRSARILRSLGHRVIVEQQYAALDCDLLVALHARRSFPSVERFRRTHPERLLVLVLTGTDLYADIHADCEARQSLEMASHLVVFQPLGVRELSEHLRQKTFVIYQSARKPTGIVVPRKNILEVCVLGHLRLVKDPFRAAEAARLLPASSRIRIAHIGRALSEEMRQQAVAEMKSNPRYRWYGELPHWKALRMLARSKVMVLSSQMEGGANVLSEAIAAAVPILASRIPSTIGILGADYPGYFPVEGTEELAALLHRGETHPAFLEALRSRCRLLQHLVEPDQERRRWQQLLESIAP